jgi:hypothetical protein
MPARIGLIAAVALCWSAGAAATPLITQTTDARALAGLKPLSAHVGGRVAVERIGASQIYAHEWPGIYFEARFRGSRLALPFDDAFDRYELLIDDDPAIVLDRPGKRVVWVTGLSAGEHAVRLQKVTESTGSIGRFGGFFAEAPTQPAPVRGRTRQIEFIGDSSMTGYGDRSDKPGCTPEELRDRTDTQQAYPALVARHFGADYQINAISGRGLVRNYAGFAPGLAMANVYSRTLPSRTESYSDPAWQPQIIVVKLNADFVGGPPKAGEKWAGWGALASDYLQAFGRFVAMLHGRTPRATILIWWFDAQPGAGPGDLALINQGRLMIADAAAQVGLNALAFLPMAPLLGANDACDHHPNLADHKRTAEWLIHYLDDHPAYWDGR